MMIMRHHYERGGQWEEGEKRGSIVPRGKWGRRVPPIFEKWHAHAHEHEAQSAAI